MKLAQDPTALKALHAELSQQLAQQTANRLSLDLTRGKPSAEQLSLSDALDDQIRGDFKSRDGVDTRNYGGIRGLSEARELGAELLGVDAAQVIAFGNSSLALMHLAATTALNSGLWGDERRWHNSPSVKMLTPVPGYDRHFSLCEQLGIEMVCVPMLDTGPDMAVAADLAAADPSIKGIWCVPKYSNPTGCIYSDATVTAIAELPAKAAADDFVVFWDNAYAVHDLVQPPAKLASLTEAAAAAGNEDHILQFASTSKITFAGAGLSFIAASDLVLKQLEQQIGFSTIGPDKVNQLRHARFLDGRLQAHMAAHAELLRPKFDLVQQSLAEGLAGWDIATWTVPKGGYFVSLDTQDNMATAVIAKAKAAGLALTAAGATYPYGADPKDCNVRIAPTFASLDELHAAMQVFLLCLKLTALEKRLAI